MCAYKRTPLMIQAASRLWPTWISRSGQEAGSQHGGQGGELIGFGQQARHCALGQHDILQPRGQSWV
jgi:hypothetical protein